MKLKNYHVILLGVILSFVSCNKDDDGTTSIPERDREEQQLTDKDSLMGYFETHYYNASTFATPGNFSLSDLIITELPTDEDGNYLELPDPENNTLLIDAVETHLTTYQETEYEYYILRLNQGGGDMPHFSDSVLANYSGNTMDGEVFDSTVNADSDFDLLSVIPGWREVLPQFSAATSFVENGDGTVTYEGYGFGAMFLPSGLGYFSSAQSGIPSYSNLIFKFELYQTEVNDHDSDGVPSYLEDLDGDKDLYNDDTDGDEVPNFLDVDDDGDDVLTKHEDLNNDGDPTNDLNSEGVPLYLDENSTESNQD
ncbi:FKBP-type peptidyl-prolyl cis-trans isomerase [Mangrovimonas sp. YM274]|uniref:FKBP-type peptidyl-prolyl cis-trans isomerase n=1 Tax=Mangrovimonas sp. YM274 TaxID=3070660 RepID=UPI0027DEA2FD|nr:FKBP-type peptidyl-prolyl cis-trans isomerase [Mangrovimonas sp. YM274]WMI70013.1 hypothetical protein RBH95_06605 [Mangrovimonas sp. YM274]